MEIYNEALNIDECIAEIEQIEQTIDLYRSHRDMWEANIKEAEKYWAECRLRLGEELKKQKDEDGVQCHVLPDGRQVSSRVLSPSVEVVIQEIIPPEYVSIQETVVKKWVVDKARILADSYTKEIPGVRIQPVRYTIQIRNKL